LARVLTVGHQRGWLMRLNKYLVAVIIGILVSTAALGADNKRFEQCRTKLKQAQKLDLLYNMDWKKGHEPVIIVGPTFYQISFDAKEGFVETLNCFFVTGESGKYINFDLLDWRTNKKVARYSYGKLNVE
jgi:hypothetical protein